MTKADSVHSTPPLNASVGLLSGLALQQRERKASLQRLARLRKEASAEIDRLIAFLDASDPYVTTELEDEISADLEDGDPAEDDDPAENDLDDEPSLGSLDHCHSQEQWGRRGAARSGAGSRRIGHR